MSNKTKIMIVDDNVTNLKLAGDLLEIEEFEVCRCLDGETAMKALDRFRPELILMDLALPGINGLQLTHKLKSEEKTKDIKIVALTASAMKGDKEKILAAGCDGYIAKPIDTRTFKGQIIRYLQKEREDHTILVVDDTENNLKLSRAIFEIAGFKVITAEDGEQAFSVLAEKKVDLVITDILMPNIDGYLLCYTIRTSEKLKDLPIIIYSATYTSSSDEAMAKEMGADKFIRRPSPAEELVNAARHLLSDARRNTHKILAKPKSIKATRLYNEGLVHKLEKRNLELEEARKDLEQSEMRLKEAQTIAHVGSWEVDMVHNTHLWSDEFFNILGSKKETALPSSELFLTFIHPDDLDFVSKVMQMALVTLSDSSFDFRFIKNGTIRNGHSKYHFEFDKDHKPLRLAGIVQDITEKKLTDEALRAAHDRLLFHIENTPLGFIAEIMVQTRRRNFWMDRS
jgi:two-component system cell cycle response regulator